MPIPIGKRGGNHLEQQDSWRATTPSPKVIARALPNLKKILALRLG
ncbi:hypothetical protein [Trichothermofontia sp.]